MFKPCMQSSHCWRNTIDQQQGTNMLWIPNSILHCDHSSPRMTEDMDLFPLGDRRADGFQVLCIGCWRKVLYLRFCSLKFQDGRAASSPLIVVHHGELRTGQLL